MDWWNFTLYNIKQSFDTMASFQIFDGLNLLQFCIILMVLHVVISLFANINRSPRLDMRSTVEIAKKSSDKEGKR